MPSRKARRAKTKDFVRRIRCADCGLKADAHGYVPIDLFLDQASLARLLCLGCLATQRVGGERWLRMRLRRDTEAAAS